MSTPESEPMPAYNDAKELERRAKMVAQSSVSVDKPGVAHKQSKGFRFRNMKVKPTKRAHRRNWKKRPQFY